MRFLRRLDPGLLALVTLVLPPLAALAQPALPRGGDLALHFHRLVALDANIGRGLFYARWMPDLVFGYGYPLFHFYAPLSTYLGEAIHLVGFDFAPALRLLSGAALVGVALGAYLWARQLLGSARAALVAGVAAVCAPFVLCTPLSRGSISDAVALALLPCAFWSLDRVRSRPTPLRLAGAGLTLAALFLSHNVTAMLTCPVLILYACAAGLEARQARAWFYPLAAIALGLVLSAFFWLPALADKGWTRLDLFTAEAEYDYRASFVSLAGLLRFPEPADAGLMNPPGPYHISPFVVLAGLVGLAGLWRARAEGRLRLTALWLAGMAFLYLSLAPSAWLWARLPLLRVIQFPFRLLGPAGIILALPAAALFREAQPCAPRRLWLWRLAVAAFLMAVILPATPLLYPLRDDELPREATLADVSRYQSGGALGTTSSGEYLPKTIEQLPKGPAFAGMDLGAGLAAKLDRAQLPDGAHVSEEASQPLRAVWRTAAPAAFEATVYTFYFPGWQARLDGEPLPVTPEPQTGLIRFTVPAGEHRIELSFGGTAVTRLADALSACGLAALLALAAAWLRGRRPPAPSTTSARATRADAVLFAALGLCLLAGKVAYVDRVDNPWRRSYDGRAVPAGAQALNADLGGQIRLLGLQPLPARLAPGQAASLVLYWAALVPLDRNYSVSIQIVDEQSNKVEQTDHYRPGGYSTIWWRMGEYNRDGYRLRINVDIPIGHYRVLAILYDENGERLQPAPGTPGAQWGAVEVQQIQVVAAG
ncbi:MAG TPA: 6-pyruvoyl-tetrahydropterin synthase-related protein [Anaerolineae bacterium]|nr:6-pyruvoyl-tetrahydropterin synthase-related protein [Anaerolineae bacterium]